MSGSATLGSATLYLQQAVLGHTLGFAAMVMPAALFVGLDTTAPTATTGGAEVQGNGYARQAATFALSTTPNVAANVATVAFPEATAPWGVIGWFELWDALTAGNRLYWGPLVNAADGVTPVLRSVLGGDIVRLSAGTVQVQAT